MTDTLNVLHEMEQVVNPRFGRPMNWNRQGNPISIRRWGELSVPRYNLSKRRNQYTVVARDTVRGGRNRVMISTVWSGTDTGCTSYDGGLPTIFETMVFGGPEAIDYRRWLWTTEREALYGHWLIRRLVRRTLQRLNGPPPLAINRHKD